MTLFETCLPGGVRSSSVRRKSRQIIIRQKKASTSDTCGRSPSRVLWYIFEFKNPTGRWPSSLEGEGYSVSVRPADTGWSPRDIDDASNLFDRSCIVILPDSLISLTGRHNSVSLLLLSLLLRIVCPSYRFSTAWAHQHHTLLMVSDEIKIPRLTFNA